MTTQHIEKLKQRWTTEAEKYLAGRKIIAVRWMTEEERQQFGWDNSAVVLLLDNGTMVWPSADDEGNDAGALFGITRSDEEFDVPVIG